MLGAATKQMMGINAWVLEEDELNLSFSQFPEKFFSNDGGSGWKIKDLKFHLDWNWLMKAVEFIENNCAYVTIKGCLVTITSEYDVSRPTKIEAVFTAVSDFAKQFNSKAL